MGRPNVLTAVRYFMRTGNLGPVTKLWVNGAQNCPKRPPGRRPKTVSVAALSTGAGRREFVGVMTDRYVCFFEFLKRFL